MQHPSVVQGNDVLEYATERLIRVALRGQSATVTLKVPFRNNVSGTSDGTATAECPPNPPVKIPTSGCQTYDGVLTLQLKIARGTVSVSARHRAFQPSGPCPGGHSVGIPPSTGTVDLTHLAARRVTVVSGKGAEASESERQTFARTAQFQVRFERAS